ncbi:unnamed protein product [Spodoptera littoralis]|uniref:Uncharacterized protein n=1 Tax=Spodoptera littoralis TaxID=7109 RepID=A0A9P0IIH1_SPOLI|nr:unnamed protein product [Spodoptera littoralis]CAH1646522.1 unnamed protein product [Spodoptera littoralis]
MKKSNLTSQELFKKARANNRVLKLPELETSARFCENTIQQVTVSHDYKKKIIKTCEKELKEEEYRNPYTLPDRLRVTTTGVKRPKRTRDPPTTDEILTVCDIDPEFFTIAEGRPVRSFYDIKTFMRDLRDATLLRANAGYVKDKILQIEMFSAAEQEEFSKVKSDFDKIRQNFLVFSEDSFKEAKYVMKLAKETALKLAKVTDELEEYSFKFVKIKNKLLNIVAEYDQLAQYKKFLTDISPKWWRKRFGTHCSKADILCSNLIAQLQSESPETMTLYRESALSLARLPPQLYYKRPSQVINFLENISRQCLHYLEVCGSCSGSFIELHMQKRLLEDSILDHSTHMQYVIDLYLKKVKTLEVTSELFKERFHEILEKVFYELVASYESSKLFMCLQLVHSGLYGDKPDCRDSLTNLMINIETYYDELSKELNCLDHVVVKKATRQIFNQHKRAMAEAHLAKKQLKEYYALRKALNKSYDPPYTLKNRWYN